MKLIGMVDVPGTVLDAYSPVGALNLQQRLELGRVVALDVIGEPPQHIALTDELLQILLASDLTDLFITATETQIIFRASTGALTYNLGEQEDSGEYAGCWHAYLAD